MENKAEKVRCEEEIRELKNLRGDIPAVVDRIVAGCQQKDSFDHIDSEPIPSRDAMVDIIHRLRRILFPGYFVSEQLDKVNLKYYLGQETTDLFEVLSKQITLCIKHDCIWHNRPCTHCEEQGHEQALTFIREIPRLRILLAKDVRAAFEGDPAAESHDEIILCYPGMLAVTVYRVAHQLYLQKISLMPRIISEYVHGLTGIDIHPAANIGESFFIDHGVGVVIGQTADIGNNVRIYQGVTLGAISLAKEEVERLRGKKRHPTIEDEVIIYSGSTILGGETVIGARSVIGGNVWLTESVPPETRIFIKKPDLILRERPKSL